VKTLHAPWRVIITWEGLYKEYLHR